jgi:3-(3-hydroxy-phenyl)propionate hydroxylase/flavoprotein hydroxylase
MLDSVDDFPAESAPEKVWARVAGYLSPDQAELIRVATYTFRSLLSHPWRDRRVFLAGDAAHQMPPFLGQGMCSGIRDARNLAFKLDLVLRGGSPDVLDTYESERLPHVTAITRKGIELGRFQTTRDPVAAAERDAKLIADRLERRRPQKLRFPDLTDGLFAAEPCPGRGELMPQGRLRTPDAPGASGGTARFDDLVTPGFQLVVRADALDDDLRRRAEQVLDTVVPVDAASDVDAVYLPWLAAHVAVAALVRPDGYVFGTAPDAALTARLVAEVDEIRTPDHTQHTQYTQHGQHTQHSRQAGALT